MNEMSRLKALLRDLGVPFDIQTDVSQDHDYPIKHQHFLRMGGVDFLFGINGNFVGSRCWDPDIQTGLFPMYKGRVGSSGREHGRKGLLRPDSGYPGPLPNQI